MGPPRKPTCTQLDSPGSPSRSDPSSDRSSPGRPARRRVWLFTLVLTALTVVPRAGPRPGRAADPVALRGPGLAARRRLLPGRGQGHPPPHRAQRALVLDERAAAGRRALPRLAAGVHRRPPHRLGARPLLQPAPALGQARVQPRPVRPRLGRLGRHRPRVGAGRRLVRPRALGRRSSLVALVENLIGVLSVSTAISLAEGTAQYRRIPEMLKIGIVVSLTNASLALMAPDRPVGEPRIDLAVRPADGHRGAGLSRLHLGAPAAREHRAAVRVDPDPPAQPAARYRARVAARPRPQDVPGRRRRDPAAAPARRRRGPALPGRARRRGSRSCSRSARRSTIRS